MRAIFEAPRQDTDSGKFYHDMRNAAIFMRSQRMHKVRPKLAMIVPALKT